MKHILIFFIISSSITIPIYSSGNIAISDMEKITPSCTIFTVAVGDTVFFGNNEDWYEQELRLWYVPSQNISTIGGEQSIYGAVFIGFLKEEKGELYPCPCGGMNEHGLMYDINGLPSLALNDNPNGSSFYTPGSYYIKTSIWDCKNVEEVIEWYKSHTWNTTIGGQIHYGDASGDAVVVSVNPLTHKWAFTRKTGNFIISTNFNLNNTGNACDYPCGRYLTSEYMLSQIENEEDLTVQACADILYAVHAEGLQYTLFSNIFDPVNLAMYLNYGENYQNQKKINLLDVLSQKNSFELYNSSEFLGVDGHILVKSVKIDEKFYSSSINSPLSPLYVVLFALCVIYIYKRKVK